MKNKKFIPLFVILTLILGSQNLVTSYANTIKTLTVEVAEKIAKGNITNPDNKLDPLLYDQPILNPDSDDDNDGILNKEEILVYTEGDRTFYTYKSHPRLKDTDGDGIADNDESTLSDRLTWNISPRDMALFMELAYREEDYIRKILDENDKNTEIFDNRNEYRLIKNELASYWKVKEVHQNSNGFFAVLFETDSTLDYLKNGSVQVLAIRGTSGGISGGDLDDDADISLGRNPGQAVTVENLMSYYEQNGTVSNLYVTGHSLGGYLAQRAIVYATDRNFSWIRNVYTFNAPRIKRNIFRPYIKEIANKSDALTEQGRSVHYATDNDNVTNLVGRFRGYISVGKSQQGHGSRSYFEERMNNFRGFTVGDRTNIHDIGRPNIASNSTNSFENVLFTAPEELIYEPTATPITIKKGEQYNLFNSITVKENSPQLPKNISMTDVTEESNRPNSDIPDSYIAKVKITYSDNSFEIVDVPVTVNEIKDNEKYDPVPVSITVYENEEINYLEGITARQGTPVLPNNITVLPIGDVDIQTPGNYEINVEVIYPDNSKDLLVIPIKVIKIEDNRIYTLQAEDEIINEGETYNITDNVLTADPAKPLPEGTVFEDITVPNTIDINTPNSNGYTGLVKVTYPDKTFSEIIVKVIVNKIPDNIKYSPKIKNLEVDYNQQIDPKTLIINNNLPENSSITWKENAIPDTSTYGSKPVTLVITYPDNTVDELNGIIMVRPLNERFTPTVNKITIRESVSLSEDIIFDAVDVKVPAEYKVKKSSKDGQHIPNKVGDYIYSVIVEYPDTSMDEVHVPIDIISLEKSTQPIVDNVYEGDLYISGRGEPDSTIRLKNLGSVIQEVKVNEKGIWKVLLQNKIKVKDRFSITQTEIDKNESNDIEVNVISKTSPNVHLYKQDDSLLSNPRVDSNEILGAEFDQEVDENNILYIFKNTQTKILLKADDIDNDIRSLEISTRLKNKEISSMFASLARNNMDSFIFRIDEDNNDLGIPGLKVDNENNFSNIVTSNDGSEIITQILGMPTLAGEYNIFLTAVDSLGKKNIKKYKIVVLDIEGIEKNLKIEEYKTAFDNPNEWIEAKQGTPALPDLRIQWIRKPERNIGKNIGLVKVTTNAERYVEIEVTANFINTDPENNSDNKNTETSTTPKPDLNTELDKKKNSNKHDILSSKTDIHYNNQKETAKTSDVIVNKKLSNTGTNVEQILAAIIILLSFGLYNIRKNKS